MFIGYARVSTEDQNPGLQHTALKAAGCEIVFEDRLPGLARKRPGLDQAIARIGRDDVLIVWKLDRLGRSLSHLIDIIAMLGERGAGFRSLSDAIDTTTPGGRLHFHMLGALAEFERSLIAERTKEGMAEARRRGRPLGRKPALSPGQVEHARLLMDEGEPVKQIARTLKVHRSTLYRATGSGG